MPFQKASKQGHTFGSSRGEVQMFQNDKYKVTQKDAYPYFVR